MKKPIDRKTLYNAVSKAQPVIVGYWDNVLCDNTQPPSTPKAQWYTHFQIEAERCRTPIGSLETDAMLRLAHQLFLFGYMLANAEGLIVEPVDTKVTADGVFNACEDLGVVLGYE